MSDLISRNDLYHDMTMKRLELHEKGLSWNEFCRGFGFAMEFVKQAPSAEPERKKGKWIKVHGYATPGGDPVWKCSECGKGIHVYGIEAPSYNRDYTDGHQWVACPNCGAEMTRGER